MIFETISSSYADSAYSSISISPLPDSLRKRNRFGDELQPMASYADLNPYHRTVEDVGAVKEHESEDPSFESKDWWWNHQKIRFLNGKLGFKALIFLVPITWVLFLWFSGIAGVVWGISEILANRDLSDAAAMAVIGIGLLLSFGWYAFAIWATPVTTNWIMSKGLAFVLKPFEKIIHRKFDETLEDGCSEFNRVTGQVRFALGRKRFFEAPFVEFDAYVERVVQHGGIFYRLMFVHRYTQKTFNKTWLSSIEADKSEVLALWDMLQRYMDVSQPLPDVPRLEPFRHLDPVTAEHDQKTGRNPRYWRDLDLDVWKGREGLEMLNRQRQYPWNQRVCKLTPKLGEIDMDTYRAQRPATASAI